MKKIFFTFLFCGILSLVLSFFLVNFSLAAACNMDFNDKTANEWCGEGTVQDGCRNEYNFCVSGFVRGVPVERQYYFGCVATSGWIFKKCICDKDNTWYIICEHGCKNGECKADSDECTVCKLECSILPPEPDLDCEEYCIGLGKCQAAVGEEGEEEGESAPGTPDSPTGGSVTIEDPLGGKTFEQLLTAITNFIFWVGMALAPVMFFISGFMFVTSGGNPGRVTTAKQIALYTIIGLVIILLASGLVAVLKSILETTS